MFKRFTLSDTQYAQLLKYVLQRDSFKCRVCKSRSNLTAHHIIFRSEGGGDFSSNLVTLCSPRCHRAVHGLVKDYFIQILAHDNNPNTPPNADRGLVFKKYKKVQRRITWKFAQVHATE